MSLTEFELKGCEHILDDFLKRKRPRSGTDSDVRPGTHLMGGRTSP